MNDRFEKFLDWIFPHRKARANLKAAIANMEKAIMLCEKNRYEVFIMKNESKITYVYTFQNGMAMVFDQYGQQMPEFQGPTGDVIEKIRAAGFDGEIKERIYRGMVR